MPTDPQIDLDRALVASVLAGLGPEVKRFLVQVDQQVRSLVTATVGNVWIRGHSTNPDRVNSLRTHTRHKRYRTAPSHRRANRMVITTEHMLG
jgi:hypothetical protein